MESKEIMELSISLKGEILSSNFSEFCDNLKADINAINQSLSTDEDFSEAADNVKGLKIYEKALIDAKKNALEQAADVQKLFEAIDDISETARQARLKLDRQIKAKKEEVRKSILSNALASVIATNQQHFELRIVKAMKGKKTVETQQAAASSEVEAINAEVTATRATMDKFVSVQGTVLVPDPHILELQDSLAVGIELARRLERQRDEEEKATLRAEKAAADAALKAEQKKTAAEKVEVEEPLNEKQAAAVQVGVSAGADTAKSTPAPQVTPATTESEADEFKRLIETIQAGFAPAKAARGALKHSNNIAKAGVFAKALGAAWNTLKGTK